MRRTFALSQPQRLLALAIDLAVVAAACFMLFSRPYPPLGEKGFWAYSALLAVLVGSKLTSPFYIKPADAISYSVPALVSLLLVNDWTSWSAEQRLAFLFSSGFSLIIVLMGLANIVTNAVARPWSRSVSDRLRLALDLVGQPQFIYTPIVLFAIYSFHRDSWNEAVTICIATGATVWWSLGEFSVGATTKLINSSRRSPSLDVAGTVAAYQDPGTVLIRQQREGDIKRGGFLYVSDAHAPKKLAIALDVVGRSDGVLVRAVCIATLSLESQAKLRAEYEVDAAYHIEERALAEICGIERIALDMPQHLVGLVAPDTTIARLYFEVTENERLSAGKLVSSNVGPAKVIYQIVEGMTREETVQQRNTYGFLRAQAQQVGIWNHETEKFSFCRWLPEVNAPVLLEPHAAAEMRADSIGHFPDTNYVAKLKSVSDLVTHNTAILGILGVGKSMLAIELVERVMGEGVKVICLDLTNQYSRELIDFVDEDHERQCAERLRAASERDRDQFAENPEEGGSISNLREAIYEDLREFLDPGAPRKLKIYNPGKFTASKQLQEPRSYQAGGAWQRGAALWTVTPVEITRIVSEAALELVSTEMTEKARVCLVYEEAHSLVPEWNTVSSEGDRQATSGTARAILQGRKYGLGCILITQRTASVTKTILNQCNTVFAMRTFDETGMDFLANYIGKDYAASLSSLPERHAVFFGKASSCENPVLIRLNDRNEFRQLYRQVARREGNVGARDAPRNPGDAAEVLGDIPF